MPNTTDGQRKLDKLLAEFSEFRGAIEARLEGIDGTLKDLKVVAVDVKRAQGALRLARWGLGILLTLLLWFAGPWRDHLYKLLGR